MTHVHFLPHLNFETDRHHPHIYNWFNMLLHRVLVYHFMTMSNFIFDCWMKSRKDTLYERISRWSLYNGDRSNFTIPPYVILITAILSYFLTHNVTIVSSSTIYMFSIQYIMGGFPEQYGFFSKTINKSTRTSTMDKRS